MFKKMHKNDCFVSQIVYPTNSKLPPPPIGHAFFRALRNPGTCPNNAIFIFSGTGFFLKGFTVAFPQKKSYDNFFFQL